MYIPEEGAGLQVELMGFKEQADGSNSKAR
jgi:hypothetical protein